MSLIALVAAIRPKSNGSSTIGMKKSVVETTPRSSSMAYTAASSREALPTHRLGSRFCAPLPARITSNTWGEILQPHPAPWLYWVRRIGSFMVDLKLSSARILTDGKKPAGLLRAQPAFLGCCDYWRAASNRLWRLRRAMFKHSIAAENAMAAYT